ncbi:MAG TPA: GNAT family N-acetyltransferase [Pseudomonadales bacterium]|nr:GNAT family N-acetyltransferase [Pseudomonadales bacterium]
MTPSPAVRIRGTTQGDLAALPALERSAAASFRGIPELAWIADDDVTSEAEHAAYIRAGTSWVIEDASVDGGASPVLGFLCAEVFEDALHVWELSVHGDHQGRGLGRRLLAHAIDHARRTGLPAVTLTTFTDVPWNAPFYARVGFAIIPSIAPGSRLAEVLDHERDLGLPVDRRCAMRLSLSDDRG